MNLFEEQVQNVEAAAKWWWVFLITGIIWLLISLLVFQFTLASAQTVAILVGIIVLIGGINEFIQIGLVSGGWKWAHGILGVLFVLFGIYALVYPSVTFITLAAIAAWVLLFKGVLDIVVAFATRAANDLWWLWLISGAIEFGIAFWAMGSLLRSAYVVIIWVGVWALVRGITEIAFAFHARGVGKSLAAQSAAAAA